MKSLAEWPRKNAKNAKQGVSLCSLRSFAATPGGGVHEVQLYRLFVNASLSGREPVAGSRYGSGSCSAVGFVSGAEVKNAGTGGRFLGAKVRHQTFYVILVFSGDSILGFPDFCHYFIFHHLLPSIQEAYIFPDMYSRAQRTHCESQVSSRHCQCVCNSMSGGNRRRGRPKLQHAERHPLPSSATRLPESRPWPDQLRHPAWRGAAYLPGAADDVSPPPDALFPPRQSPVAR